MSAEIRHANRSVAMPMLSLRNVVKTFRLRSSSPLRRTLETVQAVAGVSLDLCRGETVGLVGESGCGKSTLARCLVRLLDLSDGQLLFDGHDITLATPAQMLPFRRRMQIVFQDPYGSLNPRRRVGSIIADPFEIHGVLSGSALRRKVQDLMALVGLNPEHYNRFPSDFSGGQRQRIGIARAIALRPDFIVCDEPVSALDVSIQSQILNLLDDLQTELGLTYLFISHDLSVVNHVSDRVAVMYLGKLVEVAPVDALYATARHPYTHALLSAVPQFEPQDKAIRSRPVLVGDPPSPINPPTGCRFHPRCPHKQLRCAAEEPLLAGRPGDAPGHTVACHFPLAGGGPAASRSAAEVSR